MRQHKWTCLMIGALITAAAVPAVAGDSAKKIVHLELEGPLLEAPQANPLGLAADRLSTKGLVDRLKMMRRDDSVAAVFITMESPSMGLAQIQEVRTAIEQLRAVDKEVYIHLDSCPSTGLYWLASSATRLGVVPTGDVWITGFYGEQPYLKDMLSSIHVQADVIHIGDYKSAGEMFSRNEPSPPAAEMMDWIYDDMYRQMLEQVSASRSLSPDEMKRLVDAGPYSAETAKSAGLIDDVAYRKDFVEEIKRRHGDLPFDKKYPKEDGLGIDFSGNPFTAFSDLFSKLMAGPKMGEGAAVGLVYVEGLIHLGEGRDDLFGSMTHGASSKLQKALYDAAYDDDVKAVVLRVDSPGGSAVASEIIWNATQEIVKRRKPFIVSMGNVAGSGGYYVSCGADVIFAEPGTLTGSIGVVGMKLVTKGMWDSLGVHWQPIKRGENCDLMASDRPFSEEGRTKIRGWMEDVYGVFKSRVQAGRGKHLAKPLDSIAGGRVYTGRQAVELGLVDKLGGLQDALRHAALEAGLGDDFDVRILPKPKNFLDLFLEGLGLESQASMAHAALSSPAVQAALPLLRSLEPQKTAALLRALQALELFEHEKVMLLMPGEMVIR